SVGRRKSSWMKGFMKNETDVTYRTDGTQKSHFAGLPADRVVELVVALVATEEVARRGAAFGGHQTRVLGEEDQVARHAACVVEPRFTANRVEARALTVTGGGMVAQRRFLRAAVGGEYIEEIVFEEEHVVRRRRQRLDGGTARRGGREHFGRW